MVGEQEITISELNRLLAYFDLDIGSFLGESQSRYNQRDEEKEISSLFKLTMHNYLDEKNKPFKGNKLGEVIRNEIPTVIKNKALLFLIILNSLASSIDILYLLLIIKQVPKNGILKNNGHKTYWNNKQKDFSF